jgi:hypothetical protein
MPPRPAPLATPIPSRPARRGVVGSRRRHPSRTALSHRGAHHRLHLSLFDDETGRKTSDLRGARDLPRSRALEIRDFTLSLFDSKAPSPSKSPPQGPPPDQDPGGRGRRGIDVAGPGYSLAGKRWRCEEPTRKIAIREEARVVFQAQLIDILK